MGRKKRIGALLTALVLLVLLAVPASAAWTWQRLSNNAEHSYSPAIAVSESNVHVVWDDYSLGGDGEIFYKRSMDNGNTWSWQRLSSNDGGSLWASIAVSGSNIHVVWHDFTLGGFFNPEIFYKRSTNNGASWSWQRLSNNSGFSLEPAIAVWGSNVHVVWQDYTFGNHEIFYKRSTDGGYTWRWQRLSNNTEWSGHPAIAVSGSNVHVVWADDTLGGNREIFYKRSMDNGATWHWQRLSNNAGSSSYPAIAVDGSNVHVVWTDKTFGNYEIFYKRSTDGGQTWTWKRLSNNAGASAAYLAGPAVAVSGSNVHVVWQDTSLTGGGDFDPPEIFYKRSTDGGQTWTWQRLSNNAGASYSPAVAESNSNVHVVWEDDTFGNKEIFYKRGP